MSSGRPTASGRRAKGLQAGRGWVVCILGRVAEPLPNPAQDPAVQRVLDAAAKKGVALEVTAFSESTHTAEEAAAAVGAELAQIVKSLVFVAPDDDGGLRPIVCLVAGHNRVDIARLAAVASEPEIRRATAREAHNLTGFAIGGIPPLGHSRPVPVIMDPDLGRFQTVWAAAGTSNAVFPVPPATLRLLANAIVAPIAEERRLADREAALAGGPAAANSSTGSDQFGATSEQRA